MKKITAIFCATLFIFGFGANSLTAHAEANISGFEPKAKAAYLADAESGTQLYAFNENARLPIASMTKIMLALLIYENLEEGKLSLDEEITISEKAMSMGGSQVFLQAGKKYKAASLIKSIVISSANDASVALAERLYGSEELCVEHMNKRAMELGLTNTLFSNCTGLPKPTQYSSAKDVSVMLSRLIKHDGYFSFSKVFLDELVHPDGSKTSLTNTNKLVRFYGGCDGGKTGFTQESGHCLAATAKRQNLRLIAVVIGESDSKSRFEDIKTMFNYGFASFTSRLLLDENVELDKKIKVLKGVKKEASIRPEKSLCAISKISEDADFKVEYILNESVKAPIKSGEALGEAILFKNGVEISRTKLLATEDIEKQSYLDALIDTAKSWKI